MTRPWTWIATLLLAAGLVIAAFTLLDRGVRLSAERSLRQFESLTDADAPAALGQWAAEGELGIPLVVAALGSPRPAVADAAHQVLQEQITQWQGRPPEQCRGLLAVLARSLAEEAPSFDACGRARAARLARRILETPHSPGLPGVSPVIVACAQVLRAEEEMADVAEPSRGVLQTPARREAALPLACRPLPGGELPVQPFSPAELTSPALAGPFPAANPAIPMSGSGPRGSELADAQSASGLWQPPGLLASTSEPQVAARRADQAGQAPWPGDRAVQQTSFVESRDSGPSERPATGRGLASVAPRELIRRLWTEEATEALAELTARGFSRFECELARRLDDPDPAVRKELASVLPGLPGVDAGPWLLWLAEDANAEVRLAAIALVAPTADPRLRAAAEVLARRDPDPRIQRLAEQMQPKK